MIEHSAIYVGHVVHQRVGEIAHGFRYPMVMFLVDVDRIRTMDERSRLFGYNRRRIVSFRDGDHLGDPVRPVAENIRACVRASGIDDAIDRVLLLTQCRVFGYVFNPVSFFYCYTADGRLRTVVAEVHNTFGERHPYVLTRDGPGDSGLRVPGPDGERCVGPRHSGVGPRGSRFAVPDASRGVAGAEPGLRNTAAGSRIPGSREWPIAKKVFHVSPFFDLAGHYHFDIDEPAERMTIRIDLHDGARVRLASKLVLERRTLSDANLLRTLAAHPFMPHRVIAAIHWQALRLWYKGARYHPKPVYDPAAVRDTCGAEVADDGNVGCPRFHAGETPDVPFRRQEAMRGDE